MKNKYKAIIVEDERLARQDLKSLLKDTGQVEVVGEAEDLRTAVNLVKKYSPDIIFLDIQLTGESGFDLFEKAEVEGQVIFFFFFDEYAIRAFEVNALDYLLKPVNPERLEQALERMTQSDKLSDTIQRPLQYDDRLFLTINSAVRFLKINQIISINAAGDYSEVLIRGEKKGLVHKSMNEWESRLPEQYFCRIHRSTIINMEFVDRLEEWFNYSYRVYMKGVEQPYIMSRRYATRLKEKLG